MAIQNSIYVFIFQLMPEFQYFDDVHDVDAAADDDDVDDSVDDVDPCWPSTAKW